MTPSTLLPLGTLLLTPLGADRTFNILGAFLEAGPVAKLVLGILAAFSVGSWTVMIAKYLQLRRVTGVFDRDDDGHVDFSLGQAGAQCAGRGAEPTNLPPSGDLVADQADTHDGPRAVGLSD